MGRYLLCCCNCKYKMHILTPNEAATIYSATDAASAGFQRSGKYPNIRQYLYNVYMYVYSDVERYQAPIGNEATFRYHTEANYFGVSLRIFKK